MNRSTSTNRLQNNLAKGNKYPDLRRIQVGNQAVLTNYETTGLSPVGHSHSNLRGGGRTSPRHLHHPTYPGRSTATPVQKFNSQSNQRSVEPPAQQQKQPLYAKERGSSKIGSGVNRPFQPSANSTNSRLSPHAMMLQNQQFTNAGLPRRIRGG